MKYIKAKTIEGITEDINYDLIYGYKNISKEDLAREIVFAKQWLVDTPAKNKDNILRTSRVLTFIQNYPNKTYNGTREL